MSDRFRRDYMTIVVLLLFMAGAIVILVVIGNLNEAIKSNGRGTQCVLSELNAHRQNSYEADRLQSEALTGEPFNYPRPPQAPDHWNESCEPFFSGESHG